MGQIYQRAKNVCIWLGETDKGSQLVMNFLRSLDAICNGQASRVISKLRHRIVRDQGDFSTIITTEPVLRILSLYQCWFKSLKSERLLGALEALCQRTYWSRTWIIQEVCLAKDIVVRCGEFEVSWVLFTLAARNKEFNVLYRLLDISGGHDAR